MLDSSEVIRSLNDEFGNPLFKAYLRDKRVALVVPSPRDTPLLLEDYDVIVYLNRMAENPEQYIASGTFHVLYTCGNRHPDSGNFSQDFVDQFLTGLPWLVLAYPNLRWRGSPFFREQNRLRGPTADYLRFENIRYPRFLTSVVERRQYLLLESALESRPNTGTIALFDLLSSGLSELTIFGMTFFRTGYSKGYRAGEAADPLPYMKKFGHHNPNRQRELVAKAFQTDPRLSADDMTYSALEE